MRRFYRLLVVVLFTLLLVACETKTVYHHFEPTQINGWERNDTLKFSVPAVYHAGYYKEKITLRISNDYPFMGLTLIINQTVFPGKRHISDTLNCRVIDRDGNIRGRGIGLYEYDYPLTRIKLNAGDSLQISIRHNMKREILPGIADIGVKLSR
ncbi:gliding motility lipoprotein GldH [Prevotella sp. OH937_COT-195]|uniref:gliding motility lipoprotein GldH n=1 Tax=Prevotella sp. OH937_COT-195 TaxID=2491051 RepID=UPI000F654658|nr:gliding motility lipoprotein GldH [Prevotella sp. OH937_COT-195]RRD02333.1 gliding motility lipoprotein GldH [Prevotella sp. OH937_COT-195]